MNYPCVICNTQKMLNNINKLADVMHEQRRTLAVVTKAVCADHRIIEIVNKSRCDWIADSRIDNLSRIRTEKKKFLIRIAQESEIEKVIANSDISFQSEPAVIHLLGKEAKKQKRIHDIIIAIDLGDLREGCFYQNIQDIRQTVQSAIEEPWLNLVGIGTNLGCFGGVKTTPEKMNTLENICVSIEKEFNIQLRYVSGLTTAAQELLYSNILPSRINHGRFGEAWLTAFDSVNHKSIPWLDDDVFTLVTQLAEVKEKESKPIGEIGGDAFGRITFRKDEGKMIRGIIDCGMQDIDVDSIKPEDERIRVLGGSSDHTIVDLNKTNYQVGDEIRFRMNYSAILRSYTSRYVYKEYI